MRYRHFGCFLLLGLLMLSPVAFGAEKDHATDKSDKAEKSKAKLSLAVIDIDESYPEGPDKPGVFGDMKPTLAKIIERIDKAAADDKMAGIVLDIEGAELGRGKLEELRSAITRARKSGKKVYASLPEGMSARLFGGQRLR